MACRAARRRSRSGRAGPSTCAASRARARRASCRPRASLRSVIFSRSIWCAAAPCARRAGGASARAGDPARSASACRCTRRSVAVTLSPVVTSARSTSSVTRVPSIVNVCWCGRSFLPSTSMFASRSAGAVTPTVIRNVASVRAMSIERDGTRIDCGRTIWIQLPSVSGCRPSASTFAMPLADADVATHGLGDARRRRAAPTTTARARARRAGRNNRAGRSA